MDTLLGIVGSVSSPSKTRTAVEVALDAASDRTGVTTELLALSEYDLVTADGRLLEDYTGDTGAALQSIVEADAYVVGTPVYRASYSGALKNLFDMVPRGMWQADVAPLANSAVALVATGATAHHFLAADMELRPLFAFFGAVVAGSAYLHGDHIVDTDDGYAVEDEEVHSRLERLGVGTVDLARSIEGSEALSSLGPQI